MPAGAEDGDVHAESCGAARRPGYRRARGRVPPRPRRRHGPARGRGGEVGPRRTASPAIRAQSLGQLAGSHEQRGVPAHLLGPGVAHREHGHPQGHRLQRGEPEALVQRGMHERQSVAVETRSAPPRSAPAARYALRRAAHRGAPAGHHEPRRLPSRLRYAVYAASSPPRFLRWLGVAHEQKRAGSTGRARWRPLPPGPGRAAPPPPGAVRAQQGRAPRGPRLGGTHDGGAAPRRAPVGAAGQPPPGRAVEPGRRRNATSWTVITCGHADAPAVGGQRMVHHVGARQPRRPGQPDVKPRGVEQRVGHTAQRTQPRRPPPPGRSRTSRCAAPHDLDAAPRAQRRDQPFE